MFALKYINIRVQKRISTSKSLKRDNGELERFTEGGISIKYIFTSNSGKVRKLIKIYDSPEIPMRMRDLKNLLDDGIFGFRFSPTVHALPIGFYFFSVDELKELGHVSDVSKSYLVFVFKDDCIGLEKIIKTDDFDSICRNNVNFDYDFRLKLAGKLFELYCSLENIKRTYTECRQLQILHYDIKAENYLYSEKEDKIYIVDLDQSGVFDIDEMDYLRLVRGRFKPIAELRDYDTLFLPYEVIMNKDENQICPDDSLYWDQKERYTEIWMAWLLIYRLLTGMENPFFFLTSCDHKKVFNFLKEKSILDLFSQETIKQGDFFNSQIADENERNNSIANVVYHYNKALSPDIKMMMNEVFIKGFFAFNLRPSFYYLNTRYRFIK